MSDLLDVIISQRGRRCLSRIPGTIGPDRTTTSLVRDLALPAVPDHLLRR